MEQHLPVSTTNSFSSSCSTSSSSLPFYWQEGTTRGLAHILSPRTRLRGWCEEKGYLLTCEEELLLATLFEAAMPLTKEELFAQAVEGAQEHDKGNSGYFSLET